MARKPEADDRPAPRGSAPPPFSASEATTIRPPAGPEKLDRVGPYRILQKLGAGGMGEVYEAEQTEPVRRKVALKLIKWGMDSKAVLARFESERQALALMDHPCIAKVRIREEEPSRPSTRVKTLAPDQSTGIASNRRVDSPTLQRQLRGDLDWIVMKTLEKDRARRYGSPAELAADIRRHLGHEPVLASPPSAAYRAAKFVRRHRLGVTAAGVVLATLIAGIVATSIALVRATRAEAEARAQATRAEASHLLSLGQMELEKNPAASVAYALASLERVDRPSARRLALQALWRGPTHFAAPLDWIPPRHGGVVFSPDGMWLAASSWETGTVQLWPRDGGAPKELGAHEGKGVLHLRFGPRSDVLFSAALNDNRLRIWSVPDGNLIRELQYREPAASGLMPFFIDPNGDYLIAGMGPPVGYDHVWLASWPLAGGEPPSSGTESGRPECRPWIRPAPGSRTGRGRASTSSRSTTPPAAGRGWSAATIGRSATAPR